MELLKHSNDNIFLSEKEKEQRIKKVEKAYGKFLTEIGYDWEQDPNMAGTPFRVAKMWIKEIASGNHSEEPKITAFDNINKYDGMVFEGGIDVKSLCSHHNYPFYGKAYVAYLAHPDGKIIGLSKLNRIVDWFSRRPQVQENLTNQIHEYLDKVLEKHGGIAVHIQAVHTCVRLRGVNQNGDMQTTKMSGAFLENDSRAHTEFLDKIRNSIHLI